MKLATATLGTAALLVLLGIAPTAQSKPQDQQGQQQDKPKPQKPPKQDQKPAHRVTPPAQQPKTQHPQDQQKQQQKTQQQAQKNQQKAQQQQQKEQQKAAKTQQKQEQQQNASREHSQPANRGERAQQSPSGGGQPARGNPQQTAHYEQAHMRQYHPTGGERIVQIPQTQFQAHFGQAHMFQMPGPPMMVGGFPRFQYSGFWLVLEEPWPNYWVDSDEYYIVSDGGLYWLCDYNDPGVQIELVVITV
jgi:hypothetical protein